MKPIPSALPWVGSSHDSNQPNEWFDELTILGNEYNLNIDFLNQFK